MAFLNEAMALTKASPHAEAAHDLMQEIDDKLQVCVCECVCVCVCVCLFVFAC